MAKRKIIIIDGWYIGTSFSGAQRYQLEILKELDSFISKERVFLMLQKENFACVDYKNIKKVALKSKSKFGKTIELIRLVKRYDAIHLDFCNRWAIGKKSIVARYDLFSFYNAMGSKWYQKIMSRLRAYQSAVFSKYIVTISEFTKNDMLDRLPVKEDKIKIIPCGWQHIKNVKPDEEVIKKYELKPYQYFFFIGRLVKNKNIQWIFKEADINPDDIFVIAGSFAGEKFEKYAGKNNNIKYTGGVTDEEMAGLYKYCKAFLFPSFIEGFGMPPLEAMYYGRPIIISNTSSLPEVYEDAAHYIDPYKSKYVLEDVLKQTVSDGNRILEKYDWKISAKQWYELLSMI